jgi:hypothetical protein
LKASSSPQWGKGLRGFDLGSALRAQAFDHGPLLAERDRNLDIFTKDGAVNAQLFFEDQPLFDDEHFLKDGNDNNPVLGAHLRRLIDLTPDRYTGDFHHVLIERRPGAARRLKGRGELPFVLLRSSSVLRSRASPWSGRLLALRGACLQLNQVTIALPSFSLLDFMNHVDESAHSGALEPMSLADLSDRGDLNIDFSLTLPDRKVAPNP